ncbi:hypothetical protein ACYPKM_00910 [Pseudomonas aeruginosa]
MQINQVTNSAEHEQAMARLLSIMDAEEGTPEFAEVDRLADMINEYETKAFPQFNVG